MRRLFIFLLVIFILFDIALFFFYFLKKPSTSKISNITPEQTGSSKGSTRTNIYNLGPGETSLIPGNPSAGGLDETLFKATVEKELFYDQTTNEALITAAFTTKSGKKITADVILGKKGGKIVSTVAKSADFNHLTWGPPDEISNVAPLIKKNGPIFIKIYSQSVSQDFHDNPPFKCNSNCKQWLDDINKYYKNNLNLVRMVKGEIDGKNGLKVGPTGGIIIEE